MYEQYNILYMGEVEKVVLWERSGQSMVLSVNRRSWDVLSK